MCEKDTKKDKPYNEVDTYCRICGSHHKYTSNLNHTRTVKHQKYRTITLGVINLYKGRLNDLIKLIEKYKEIEEEDKKNNLNI